MFFRRTTHQYNGSSKRILKFVVDILYANRISYWQLLRTYLSVAPALMIGVIMPGWSVCAQDESISTEALSPVQKIIGSEELMLRLNNVLPMLNRAAHNLRIPMGESASLFSSDATVSGRLSAGSVNQLNPYLVQRAWNVDAKLVELENGVWRQFLDQVAFLEAAKFYFVEGKLSSDASRLDSKMGFKCRCQFSDGCVGFVKSKIAVEWTLLDSNIRPAVISSWQTISFDCIETKRTLFDDVTSNVIRDPDLLETLLTSRHEEITRKLISGESVKTKKQDKYSLFFPEVTLEHPSVSVVDIDADGFDDFFLCRIYEPSLMFRNNGDGTFTDIAPQIGLNIDHDCTSSLFADFDNDGDQDVFLGRARNRAIFLRNENGRFVNQTRFVCSEELPFMVSSMSAADYDNNGLLDIYFSTYSPIEGSHANLISKKSLWPSHFLNGLERAEYFRRQAKAHPYLNLAGPPNLLLKNIGGAFVRPGEAQSVECWRKSFQSSWCDFDQDGDQDLYVCNDFAPDDLFRNDQGRKFVRVSDEIGLDRLGFGMGVSWGDHNNDGQFDLYVSNMYSKAGRRITKQVAGLDTKLRQMSEGNYLYEYADGIFKLVSLKGAQDAVAKTGWSWGGQLADFDNDGFQDIVVANGYYSAPPAVAGKVDL